MISLKRNKHRLLLLVFAGLLLPFLYMMGFIELHLETEYDYEMINYKRNTVNLEKEKHITKLLSYFSCSDYHIKVLVMVTSKVSSFTRRETIRKTWGASLQKEKNQDFRVYFAVGKSYDEQIMKQLNIEMEKHKDIILGDFFEKFYNLPHKVETTFEWAYKHCNYDYFYKVDDDVFINLSNLFQLINNTSFPKEKVYSGRLHSRPSALRTGKYKLLRTEYNGKHYPPFVSGGAALFSYDVIRDMIMYFTDRPFKLDDVYIGILIYNIHVPAVSHGGTMLWEEKCEYNSTNIAQHSKQFTKHRFCQIYLFYSMLKKESHKDFTQLHYKGHKKMRGVIYDSLL